jgi:hypothetical protein
VFGATRLQLAVEEHGGGCQLIRVRAEPRCGRGPLITAFFAILLAAALSDGAWIAAGALGLAAAFFAARTVAAVADATSTARRALDRVGLAGNTK